MNEALTEQNNRDVHTRAPVNIIIALKYRWYTEHESPFGIPAVGYHCHRPQNSGMVFGGFGMVTHAAIRHVATPAE